MYARNFSGITILMAMWTVDFPTRIPILFSKHSEFGCSRAGLPFVNNLQVFVRVLTPSP